MLLRIGFYLVIAAVAITLGNLIVVFSEGLSWWPIPAVHFVVTWLLGSGLPLVFFGLLFSSPYEKPWRLSK